MNKAILIHLFNYWLHYLANQLFIVEDASVRNFKKFQISSLKGTTQGILFHVYSYKIDIAFVIHFNFQDVTSDQLHKKIA